MTIGPEQRNADFNSQQAAYQKNAAMRGDESHGTFVVSIGEPTLEQIHRRLNAENIDLRGQLELARKATSAAQELLENTRSELAKIEADGAKQAFSMGEAMGAAIRQKATLQSSLADARGECHRLKHDLDTEKLLRINDASTIADLERRLREAEGQLRAQRLSAAEVSEIRAYVPYGDRVARAENVELRRTISLMAKTAAEVQDNFRLITELAADPADEKRKEPKP